MPWKPVVVALEVQAPMTVTAGAGSELSSVVAVTAVGRVGQTPAMRACSSAVRSGLR